MEISRSADGTACARLPRVDIAIDVVFEPRDAFPATVLVPPERAQRPSTIVPVAICAFIAFTFATLAFLKSPLASHPRVAPYTSAIMAKLG